jgi:glucose 1-dehydrogenase
VADTTAIDNEDLEPDAARRAKLLRGRVAIVTGSDSGIGKAIAQALALEGADVAVTYHSDEDGAKATADQVEAAGSRAIVRHLDVRDEGSVTSLMAATVDDLGVPDILVNCAGIGGSKPLVETTFEDFDHVIKTDLYGPFLFCREFVRRRQGRKGGKIINITSVHEAIPSPGNVSYGAAKGGLLTLTRSLAMELAEQRINVNAIAPGLIRTPMTVQRTDDPEARAKEMPRIPWHRPGEPWEVARLAVYLASDEADYVTGQSFTIDGGLEMNWGQGA